MVLQRTHRKDHGPRSDARIMGHHPPDYGCPSEAGHGGLLSKGCCLSEAGHVYTKRPFKSLGCCEGMCHMVLQRAHRKDHGLRSDARIMDHHPSDYGCSSEAGHGTP